MTIYLTVAEVIAIHDEIMRRTGNLPEGLRDEGLLESALMRAQTSAYYEDAGIIRQAALMATGIALNHPFVDGNKRAAYAVLDVFLRVNDHLYTGDPVELAKMIEAIVADAGERLDPAEDLERWVSERTRSGS